MKTSKLFLILIGGLFVAQAYAADTLADRWTTLRAEQPKLQIRDAARNLGVSEAELLATNIGKGVTLLQNDEHSAREIMRRAMDLGTVLATSRNENGVIERTGVATKAKPREESKEDKADPEKDKERQERMRNFAGGYLGGEIDLRFHFLKWKHAFAVVQPGRDGSLNRSLQFFDASGMSIHKIYLKNEAGIPVFDKLVNDFRHASQTAALTITPGPTKPAVKADASVDLKEFQLAWTEMTDVHQFSRILTEFGVSREQAFKLAPAGAAERVSASAIRTLLDEAAKQNIAIMAFLGNTGITQIFSGNITKTAASGDWYNVLDPAFNLHIRESNLKNGWVIQRGGVTSVEFFDKNGDLVVSFFGVRERAKPQPESWTALTKNLPRAAS